MSRARYYISFDNITWTEFYPTNQPKITYVREANEIFFRPKVDKFRIGRTKNESVYDDLYQMFFDFNYFSTDVYYKINVLGTDKFYFIDPITSGKIDTQNNVYESTPDCDDEYHDILKQYQKKWYRGSGGLFSLTQSVYYPEINQTFVNVDFDTFTDSVTPGSISYANASSGAQYARNQVSSIYDTEAIIIIIKNLAYVGNAPTMYGRDTAGTTLTNTVTINANGIYTLTATASSGLDPCYVYLAQTDAIAGSSGSFDYEVYEYVNFNGLGRDLENAIKCVIQNASWMNLGSIDVVSTYLFNDALPTGSNTNTPNVDAYITANPTNDYVIEGAANWNFVVIDRVDEWCNDIQDSFEYSLKDIMDLLKTKLRAWWYIDEDGKFRIEHEKYFRDYIVQADLTTYTNDKPEVDVKVYSYEKGDVYTQLNYTDNNSSNEDWLTYPFINFSATLTSNNVKDISTNATTDIKYVLDNPTDASTSGFVLLRCVAMGANYRIAYDQSTITATNYYLNAKLGWAYIFANYMDYFAEAQDGTVNNAAKTFTHVKEVLKQNNIRFRLTTDLNWKKPFTLAEGTGWFEGGEYEPETGMYKINVGYNPYAIQIYVVDSTDSTTGIVDDDGTTDIIL